MRDVRIRENDTHGYPRIIRVRLDEALEPGSHAAAKRLAYDGTAEVKWQPTDEVVEVYDSIGTISGVEGDKFWAIYKHDSKYHEILGPGAGGDKPIRFRLTSSISVFGTGTGVRQKWNGSAFADDGDFPDPVTLVDYVGSASSGDTNDKCFAVPMADHADVYEIVEIQQSGGAQFIVFELDQEGGITHDDETADAIVVTSYGAGLDPDDTVTVRSFETHTTGKYAHYAENGYRGIAQWNGTDWSIIELEQVVKNAEIEFTCTQTVATTDASFSADVTRILGDAELLGVAEEDSVTIYNRADVTNYVFTGSNGTSVGLARWDHRLKQWDAVWVTCPAE